MAPRVKLTYFPLYGRVETMKMCLAYGKVLDKFAVLTEKKLNTIHFGGTYDFKEIFEVGGGYKSTRYMNVMAIVKTKFGLSLAYAYDFRGASNDVEVQRSVFPYRISGSM